MEHDELKQILVTEKDHLDFSPYVTDIAVMLLFY